MHNSSTTKIQLESKNDFYDALEDINEVSDQMIKHSFKKENTELEHLVRKRMNDVNIKISLSLSLCFLSKKKKQWIVGRFKQIMYSRIHTFIYKYVYCCSSLKN